MAAARPPLGSREQQQQPVLIASVVLTTIVVSFSIFIGVLSTRTTGASGHGTIADPALLSLSVVSDLLTAFSYLAISLLLCALVYIARHSIPFHGMFLAFGLFIVSCGATHAMHVISLWRNDPALEVGIKLFTAVVSLITALALPPLLPKALSIIANQRLAAERKQALEQTNQDLQHEIAERRRIEEALQQEKINADAANKAKSEFLAVMSHEMRTPMNGMLGMTELLMGTKLTPDQCEYAHIVHRSGQSLLTLINDILDFSKIEAGKMVSTTEDFAPVALVEDVRNVVVAQAREKGVELHTFVAPTIPAALHGDQYHLRQVLLNLLGNAIKFTEQGSVWVRLTGEQQTATGMVVRFAVEDTGIGIAAQAHDLLFQPFTQVDSSMTRRYGGTGLGLAICKHLVEMMGGEVGVESAVGQGSTFWFTLPLAPATGDVLLPSPEISYEEEVAPTEEPDQRTGQVILLAEDNPVNQKLAQLQLQKLGYDVVVVGTGRQAVAAAQHDAFALILMDCQMPDVDGFVATSMIRQHEQQAGMRRRPIIALTANAMHGDREACIAAGMDDYIAKPFKLEQLRSMIEQWTPRDSVQATA